MRIALTVAGSDSGGGAGIQADLKTFHQFGVFGTSVITAITAQNTRGVRGWEPVAPALVVQQLDAVAEDLAPQAVKSGMLGTADIAAVVAAGIERHALPYYVLDPVMIASSGDRLLDADAEGVIRHKLVPLATLVTPNLDEAEILCGDTVRTEGEMEAAGRALIRLGAGAALIKGGHSSGEVLVDLLVTKDETHRFAHARMNTRSTHGTGCTLSSAITAGLALGDTLVKSVREGLEFVNLAIGHAPGLGAGTGPLNHFVATRREQP